MASDLNKWMGLGRLTVDPKMMGEIEDSKRVCFFSIANHKQLKNKIHRNFFNCVAYTNLADLIMQYCRKGDLIAIEGELQQNNWTDKKGNQHYGVDIKVYKVQFLSREKKESQEDFDSIKNIADSFQGDVYE